MSRNSHQQQGYDKPKHGNNRREDLYDKDLDEELAVSSVCDRCIGTRHAYGCSANEVAESSCDSAPEECET